MRTSKAAMNDGYDIPSPENIGGLWLAERLLALPKNYFYIHHHDIAWNNRNVLSKIKLKLM